MLSARRHPLTGSRFTSRAAIRSALHGTIRATGACVIMAGRFAVTRQPGTDLFAKRFSEAGAQ